MKIRGSGAFALLSASLLLSLLLYPMHHDQTRQIFPAWHPASTSVQPSVLLFLDYDGVLQTPQLRDFVPFEFVPQLARVLAPFPEVGLIVSSSHREGMSVGSIRSAFPGILARRIMGATPCRPYGRAKEGRYREILEWLTANNCANTPWLALDDEGELYPERCAHLLKVHPLIGFQMPYDEQLTQWLEEITGRLVVAR